MSEAPGERAIVIGSGTAGLCAARILAGFFDEVVVIERDAWQPYEPGVFRKGVPQAAQIHQFTVGGLNAVEQVFAGLTTELYAAGALRSDWLQDRRDWDPETLTFEPSSSGLVVPTASNPLIESTLRRMLLATNKVRVVAPARVVGLLGDSTRVTGVRIEPRTGSNSHSETGALVVDASGLTSSSPSWLEALGCPPTSTVEVDASWGFAARHFRLRPGATIPFHELGLGAGRGVLQLIEQDRAILTFSGVGEARPSGNVEEFEQRASQIEIPLFQETLTQLEPISRPFVFRALKSRLHKYHEAPMWPEGFLVLGDAVMRLHPHCTCGMYTAGMFANALAESLQRHRDEGTTSLTPEIQRNVFPPRMRALWEEVTGWQYAYPTATINGAPISDEVHAKGKRLWAERMSVPRVARWSWYNFPAAWT